MAGERWPECRCSADHTGTIANMGDMGDGESALIVELDDVVLEELVLAFRNDGFVVRVARCAAEALEVSPIAAPDVVVVDAVLPDMAGSTLCSRLRSVSDVAIVMVGSSDADFVEGLECGADAYVPQHPIRAREVAARARAVIRRIHAV